MSSKYNKDKDLEFMRYTDSEMLSILSKYVFSDKSEDKNTHQWNSIAGELQHFGGNSIANFFRRTGVLYYEILIDVCDELKVTTNKEKEAVDIEQDLLAHLFGNAWKEMSKADKDSLKSELGTSSAMKDCDAMNDIAKKIQSGGKASYVISGLTANATSQAILGVGLGGAMALPFLGLLSPIGMLFSAILGIKKLTGPNYKITIPAVIQIAAMRQQMLNSDEVIF